MIPSVILYRKTKKYEKWEVITVILFLKSEKFFYVEDALTVAIYCTSHKLYTSVCWTNLFLKNTFSQGTKMQSCTCTAWPKTWNARTGFAAT